MDSINKIKELLPADSPLQDDKALSEFVGMYELSPEVRQALEEEWEMQEDKQEKDLSKTVYKLNYLINSENESLRPKWRGRLVRWSVEIAAAALLAIAIIGITLHNLELPEEVLAQAYGELQAPANARVRFHLPDGTEGWLNSGSTLKYSLNYKTKREVELWGEAFFSVAKTKDLAPFNVLANGARIEVWGTRFDVIADENGQTAEVVLEEGKVEVHYKTTSASNQSVMLEPGERLLYDNQKKQHTVECTNPSDYIQWINGRFVIRNLSISEFAEQFGRRYNIDIVVNDPKLSNVRFRATFENESPEEILRLLDMITPIKYTIQERALLADGTFSKKRVTFNYRQKNLVQNNEIYE